MLPSDIDELKVGQTLYWTRDSSGNAIDEPVYRTTVTGVEKGLRFYISGWENIRQGYTRGATNYDVYSPYLSFIVTNYTKKKPIKPVKSWVLK